MLETMRRTVKSVFIIFSCHINYYIASAFMTYIVIRLQTPLNHLLHAKLE